MKVKSGSIFYKGKRIADMQNVTYSIATNDTQELTDGGPHNTDGIAVTKISCDVIVPVAGTRISVVKDALKHEDVALSLGIFDGSIHEIQDARATDLEFSGEAASGKQTGKFSWHGGAPKITG